MTTRIGRQSRILELIRDHVIETQEQLAKHLQESGYSATQATLSRDMKELKLTKITDENGRSRYAEKPEILIDDRYHEKYIQTLKNGFISMDKAGNLLVIKTVPGMAMAVAASIDSMNFNGLVGCIAGDDTIMCAVRTVKELSAMMTRIQMMMK